MMSTMIEQVSKACVTSGLKCFVNNVSKAEIKSLYKANVWHHLFYFNFFIKNTKT